MHFVGELIPYLIIDNSILCCLICFDYFLPMTWGLKTSPHFSQLGKHRILKTYFPQLEIAPRLYLLLHPLVKHCFLLQIESSWQDLVSNKDFFPSNFSAPQDPPSGNWNFPLPLPSASQPVGIEDIFFDKKIVRFPAKASFSFLA